MTFATLALSAAQAATLQVPADYTLAEAVAAAVAGDSIALAPGAYDGPVVLAVDLTLVGTGGSTVTSLHGVGGSALEVTGAAVTVEGLALTADPGDWAIATFSASVGTLSDVRVSGSPRPAPAAIVARGSPLTITASTFTQNTGVDGHLSLLESPLVATDVDFSFGGRSPFSGGVRADRSEVTLSGGTISDHDYDAITVIDAPATFSGVTFERNYSSIDAQGSTTLVVDSTFSGPNSGQNQIYGENATIQRCVFEALDGSGVLLDGAAGLVEDSVFIDLTGQEVVSNYADEVTFRRNVVSGSQGGMWLGQGFTNTLVVIEDNVFVDNTDEPVLSFGDAVDVRIERNLFAGNRSYSAIHLSDIDHVEIRHNEFVDNRTWSIVTPYNYDTEDVLVENNLFATNVIDAPLIYVLGQTDGWAADIRQNTFVSNELQTGLVDAQDGQLDPAITTFRNNLVIGTRGGPVIATAITLGHNLFWDNLAGDLENGGALPATNLSADPLLDTWHPGSIAAAQDLVLLAGSPAIDAGDPAFLDLDGSVSDIGLTGGPTVDPRLAIDVDADGSSALFDCDDADGALFPGAIELCDDVDQDCDGDPLVGYAYDDLDADGLGDPTTGAPTDVCDLAGSVLVAGDCDDADDTVAGPTELYADTDGDGFGSTTSLVTCPVAGWVAEGGDCDDTRAESSPLGVEVCDGVDDDCDGAPDDGVTATWFPDADGDGLGDASSPTEGCGGPGLVAEAGDCDDQDAALTDLCDDETTDPADPEAKPEGCGCQTSGAGGWGLLLALALVRRRQVTVSTVHR